MTYGPAPGCLIALACPGRLSVLVVEDDRDHREPVRDTLTALGARVIVAVNGEEGVKRLIADGCPDLVLCDLRMPVMDGYQFVREVHEPQGLADLMRPTGLGDVHYRRFGLGTIALHVGIA